jgi:hypothetical protein
MTIDADLRVDGNAAAGFLDQLFAFEITAAVVTCDGCAYEAPIGALHVYDLAMGAVCRCPACEHLMIAATWLHGVWRLDLRGVRQMKLDAPAAPIG